MIRALLSPLLLLAALAPADGAERVAVSWQPPRPRVGDVVSVHVSGAGQRAEGELAGHPLGFFPQAGGQAALVGLDLEGRTGARPWRITVHTGGRTPRVLTGTLRVEAREFPVQRLALPPAMVDLDPETERRALAEGERLRGIYRTISPERLWSGAFVPPVAAGGPGTGFGARRVINGQPRAPHTGLDYAAPRGTPVVAANAGRVALVGDYFFPGRFVVLDHGLGAHTLYFHLDEIAVGQGQRVARGERLGSVGSTGRATGPHLHFGALVGAARVDPAALLGLTLPD